MLLNEILIRQNIINNILFVSDNFELQKELKVKLMRIRIALNKIKSEFDNECKTFVQQIIPERYSELNKENRTNDEESEYMQITSKINLEYQEFLKQKGLEDIEFTFDKITEDEYSDILNINSSKNVTINNNVISALDFMELFYNLFVE